MSAMTNEARIHAVAIEADRFSGSIDYNQNALLDELPGIAFGLITLAYIVSSLLALV
jgi:hypothetical protein